MPQTSFWQRRKCSLPLDECGKSDCWIGRVGVLKAPWRNSNRLGALTASLIGSGSQQRLSSIEIDVSIHSTNIERLLCVRYQVAPWGYRVFSVSADSIDNRRK